jgi:hypothetical protein
MRLSAATFQPHLHTRFRVATSAGDVELRLAEVTDMGRGRFDRFALLFHGPPEPLLPQGLYVFRHDELSDLDLFIAPVVGSDAQRTLYEAVFNVAPDTSRE